MFQRIINKLKRLKYNRLISSDNIETRFNEIYNNNLWFKNGKSKSGAGSTLEATKNIREKLPSLLKDLKAKNLTDLGCGDFYWMKEIDLPCPYVGLDIVSSIIDENNTKYSKENRQFIHHNAVENELPFDSDIILCREVLFHLSFDDGIKMIDHIFKSNARYLIITCNKKIDVNYDIRTGEFRNINLLFPPFNFPVPLEWIQDSETVSSDRFLGIWDLNELRTINDS